MYTGEYIQQKEKKNAELWTYLQYFVIFLYPLMNLNLVQVQSH